MKKLLKKIAKKPKLQLWLQLQNKRGRKDLLKKREGERNKKKQIKSLSSKKRENDVKKLQPKKQLRRKEKMKNTEENRKDWLQLLYKLLDLNHNKNNRLEKTQTQLMIKVVL